MTVSVVTEHDGSRWVSEEDYLADREEDLKLSFIAGCRAILKAINGDVPQDYIDEAARVFSKTAIHLTAPRTTS